MKKYILSAFAVLSLSACSTGDMKSTLGLRKSAPDEFAVISHPPLSVPPAFDLAEPTDEPKSHTLFTESVDAEVGNDDKAFLQEFNKPVVKTPAHKQIDEDLKKHRKSQSEKGAIRKTLSNVSGAEEEKVIDPVKERRRIRDNISNNAPINEGEVSNKSKSTLDRIFG